MKELLDKKLFWVFFVLCFLLVLTTAFSNRIIDAAIKNHYDEISDVIIKKLQKEYSPSPYGPGIDPDKVDVNAMLIPKSTDWEDLWGEYRDK